MVANRASLSYDRRVASSGESGGWQAAALSLFGLGGRHCRAGLDRQGRWEVDEDGYQEQIVIPKEQRELAATEGTETEYKQNVTVQITNLTTGEIYTARLAITGNRQTCLPQLIEAQL